MEDPFVISRVWEFLGPAEAPMLRLVSRSWRDALAEVPRELLRVEDYLSPLPLFIWAWKELNMKPHSALVACRRQRGGISKCSSGCGQRKGDALGPLVSATMLQGKAIFMCSSGCEPGDLLFPGAKRLARQLRLAVMWRCFSGCELRTLLVLGAKGLATKLQKKVILSYFSGCEHRIPLVLGLRILVY
jgi:hypothetical protein